MPRMICACGIKPTTICSKNRSFVLSRWVVTIFTATNFGSPRNNFPCGQRATSKCARLVGSQPRLAAQAVHHLGLRNVKLIDSSLCRIGYKIM